MAQIFVCFSHTEAQKNSASHAGREQQLRHAEESVAGINQFLVRLGKRPADQLPEFKECPQCGSSLVHTTVNRVKCQGCGAILAQREPASEKVDGAPA